MCEGALSIVVIPTESVKVKHTDTIDRRSQLRMVVPEPGLRCVKLSMYANTRAVLAIQPGFTHQLPHQITNTHRCKVGALVSPGWRLLSREGRRCAIRVAILGGSPLKIRRQKRQIREVPDSL